MAANARLVSRRKLGKAMAGAAVGVPLAVTLSDSVNGQQEAATASPEVATARRRVAASISAIEQMTIPAGTQPAFRFEPKK